MNSIDWSWAPEGATHALPTTVGSKFFKQDHAAYDWVNGKWRHMGPDLGECVFAPNLIERPAPQNDESQNVARIEWDGEGLPPVGVSCEVTPHNDVWGFSTLETRPCSVIAYHADFAWIDLGGPGVPVATRIDKVDFTPIRTPEQIAADEREHGIRNACTDISKALSELHEAEEPTAVAIIEAMIDAGYRKP